MHKMVHSLKEFIDPLKSVFADAIGILVVASLTWTLLLLKRRWLNSFFARLCLAGNSSDVRPSHARLAPERTCMPAESAAALRL